MSPEFKPRHEIDVILGEICRDGESVQLIHRTGTIFLYQPTKGPPEVHFKAPEYASINIFQMEAILEAMRKFKP